MNRQDGQFNTTILLMIILSAILGFGLGALLFGLELLRQVTP